jgi:hypothetical protein
LHSHFILSSSVLKSSRGENSWFLPFGGGGAGGAFGKGGGGGGGIEVFSPLPLIESFSKIEATAALFSSLEEFEPSDFKTWE